MKKNKLFTSILLSIFFLLFLAPLSVFSADVINPYNTMQVPIPGLEPFQDAAVSGSDLQTTWIAEYIAGIYKYGIGIIAIVAMLAIAIGGAMWIVSAGNSGQVNTAKSWITNGLIGLALGLGSYLILGMVNYDLINFKVLNLSGLKDSEQAEFTADAGTLTGAYTGQPNIKTNINSYDNLLKNAANQYQVDCTLLKAIMMAESGGRPNAVSSAGAKGLMQIMPNTFAGLNVGSNPFDPSQSINAGAKYLSRLMKDGCNNQPSNPACDVKDLRFVIAAYNAGPGCNKVSITCANPPTVLWRCKANFSNKPNSYLQTYNYVGKVSANYNHLLKQGWGCK